MPIVSGQRQASLCLALTTGTVPRSPGKARYPAPNSTCGRFQDPKARSASAGFLVLDWNGLYARGQGGLLMPTLVKFAGGTDLRLKEDFDKVNSQLTGKNSGLFNREQGDAWWFTERTCSTSKTAKAEGQRSPSEA